MRYKTKKQHSMKSFQRIKWVFVVISLFLIPALILSNMAPVVQTVCASQARSLCTRHMNEAVMEELSALNVEYNELVNISYDSNGNISVIETNAVSVNRLKALLTDAVNARLATIPDQKIGIPLGTLTGFQLLSGRGPRIELRMSPVSYVQSSIVNLFDSAGINQTRHQIMLDFTVTMTAILAPYATTVDVSTSICIAQTVVIGAVPQTFADFT